MSLIDVIKQLVTQANATHKKKTQKQKSYPDFLSFITYMEASLTLVVESNTLLQTLSDAKIDEATALPLIKAFLAKRDARVTRSPIGYTAQPETLANRLCEQIVDAICQGKTQRERYQLLMPSLGITGVYVAGDTPNNEGDLPAYREVILSDELLKEASSDGKSTGCIIHVAALLKETAFSLLLKLLFDLSFEQLDTISKAGDLGFKINALRKFFEKAQFTPLSVSETIRIKQFFPSKSAPGQYIAKLELLCNAMQLRPVSVCVMLQELIDGLIAGGDDQAEARRNDPSEEEEKAGKPATLAISAFMIWWNALPDDLKKELEALSTVTVVLQRELDELRKKSNEDLECVEIRADLLTRILSLNKDYTIKCRQNARLDTYIPFELGTLARTKTQWQQSLDALTTASPLGQDAIISFPKVLIISISRPFYSNQESLHRLLYWWLDNNQKEHVIDAYLTEHSDPVIREWITHIYLNSRFGSGTGTEKSKFFAIFLKVIQNHARTANNWKRILPFQDYQHMVQLIGNNCPELLSFKNMDDFIEILNIIYHTTSNRYYYPILNEMEMEFAKKFTSKIPILFKKQSDFQHIRYFAQTEKQVIALFAHLKKATYFDNLEALVTFVKQIPRNYQPIAYILFADRLSSLIKERSHLDYLVKFIIDARKFAQFFQDSAYESLLKLLLTENDPTRVVALFDEKKALVPTLEELLYATGEYNYPVQWRKTLLTWWLTTTEIVFSIDFLQSLGRDPINHVIYGKDIEIIFNHIRCKHPSIIQTKADWQQATEKYSPQNQLGAFIGAADIVVESIDELKTLPRKLKTIDPISPLDIRNTYDNLQRKKPALISSLAALAQATARYNNEYRPAAYIGFAETWITFIPDYRDWEAINFLKPEEKTHVFGLYVNYLVSKSAPALTTIEDLAYLGRYIPSKEQLIIIFEKTKSSPNCPIVSMRDLNNATLDYPSLHKACVYKLFATGALTLIKERADCRHVSFFDLDVLSNLFKESKVLAFFQTIEHIREIIDDWTNPEQQTIVFRALFNEAMIPSLATVADLNASLRYIEGAKLHSLLKQVGRTITLLYNKKEHIGPICASSLAMRFMVQLINTQFAPVYEALYIADPGPTLLKSNFIDKIRHINGICQEHNPQQLLITLVLTHITENPDDLPAKAWALLGNYTDQRDLYTKITGTAEQKQNSGLYFVWSTRFEPYESKNSPKENTVSSHIKSKIAGL